MAVKAVFKAFSRETLGSKLNSVWYEGESPHFFLLTLEALFRVVVGLRRGIYRYGLKKSYRLPVPVIVIGNLSVGGAGKTPLAIWLAEFLQRSGYAPGIVSRGYGGKITAGPRIVRAEHHPHDVGDEAVLMARRLNCPICVGADRVAAAREILRKFQCNIIISDDGLQHYALARDLEIAVVDGMRRHGNNRCLPAGPLREPLGRLREVNMIVCNGTGTDGGFSMETKGDIAVNLATGSTKNLSDFRDAQCHALAGIGNPRRFFEHLSKFGLSAEAHVFTDHHRYNEQEINFDGDGSVLMTEKDAVKIQAFATDRHWYVPVEAVLQPEFGRVLLKLLREKCDA